VSNPGISILEGKYMVTMDQYPQQSKEFTQVHQFYENLQEGRLTTTRCRDCGMEPFPPRILCPNCHQSNLEWVDWPTTGTVVEFTEEAMGIPLGFGEPPLIHALVELPGKKTLFTRIVNCREGELACGDQLKLAVFAVDPVPQEIGREVVQIKRVCYAFEPVR
jgi:uncharacterized OB-fold protein